MQIQVWSDILCPFCYIGKRHLEAALNKLKIEGLVTIEHKSFELDPNSPKSQSQSIYEVLATKYGRSIEWAKQANQSVVQMGEAAGIPIAPDKIVPTNSFDAHRLIHFAKSAGKEDQALNHLYQAYFVQGRDVAKMEVLKEIALEVGLDPKATEEMLSSEQLKKEVREDEEQAQQIGITGVPFFLINGKYAISGAQPMDAFVQALTQIAAQPN